MYTTVSSDVTPRLILFLPSQQVLVRRLHLRKCQCREKTPPCRNCPKCKYIADIMTITDVQAQQSMCQIRFKCEICSCKCAAALCNDHLCNSQPGCRNAVLVLRHLG